MPGSTALQLATVQPGQREAEELALRRRLGVPDDAERVLVFGETSHWDPNWLHTTEEYYELRIVSVLDKALDELQREPRRVFAIESLFFLMLYWDRRPGQRGLLRELFEAGQLRLTGTGITTPDTVLPHTEAILRDYLHGQCWLREQGIEVEPRLAYLPDDFGHSPALPGLLQALGFDYAAVTRIDGMYFVAADYRRKSSFPLPGSSAALLEELATLDFVWRGPDGSEVLCHWNAFTYFQGDMLAHLGIVRWMGTAFGVPCRLPRHIARRIRGYVKQLAPLSRTPYLFCPIGCDFNDPIPDLLPLFDRYNQRDYQETGIWVVNAGLEDYLALVDAHRHELPTLELDPNPYWMGFYASRPEAKVRCNRIVRKLLLAEKLVAGSGQPELPETLRLPLTDAWERVVLANHHDFITGTSPDRIWQEEQQPWLAEGEELADWALEAARAAHFVPPVEPPGDGEPPQWTLHPDGVLEVATPHYTATLAEATGGCLVSLRDGDGVEVLDGPGNDLVLHRDSGGLWRMGHEFLGGTFRAVQRASAQQAALHVTQRGPLLEVQTSVKIGDRQIVRWLWFRQDSPVIRMRMLGAVRRGHTVTCRFPTSLGGSSLVMDVPGAVVQRPRQKLYEPTFWPARSFVHLVDQGRPANDDARSLPLCPPVAPDAPRGLAAFLGGPACVSADLSGALQWVTFRNAPKERAFGVLPLLAHPARGTDPGEGVFDYALVLTPRGDFRANQLPQRVRRALRAAMFPPRAADLDSVANGAVTLSRDDVLITALKPASRGEGLIARLQRHACAPVEVRLDCASKAIRSATLCDARERDLAPLELRGGGAIVPCRGALTSVRLVF